MKATLAFLALIKHSEAAFAKIFTHNETRHLVDFDTKTP